MNREQIEKMFDERFVSQKGIFGVSEQCRIVYGPIATSNDIKQFIFETVIPDVLKSVTVNDIEDVLAEVYGDYSFKDYTDKTMLELALQRKVKQKAKDLYGINL